MNGETYVNGDHDFRSIILEQQKEAPPAKWEGNLIDYMQIVEKHPEIANLSPARIYNMIMKHGVRPVDETIKTKVGAIKRWALDCLR